MSAISHNRALGGSGEDRAADWYKENGYEIVDRNWRSGRLGEIDLVAFKRSELVIVEVKARSSDKFGLPAEAITSAKQLRLRQLGANYLDSHRNLKVRNIRFDVVSVVGEQMDVLTDAFFNQRCSERDVINDRVAGDQYFPNRLDASVCVAQWHRREL